MALSIMKKEKQHEKWASIVPLMALKIVQNMF